MDCEGAEFEILPALSVRARDAIKRIRLECHGDARALLEGLARHGFVVERARRNDVWLTRASER